MSKLSLYVKDSYSELKKVSWLNWSQLQHSAMVVLVSTLVVSLLILVMDLAFKNIMTFIYQLLS